MILVISPSKKLQFKGQRYPVHTLPELLDSSQLLIRRLEKLNPEQIKKLMGISDKLAQLNWQRYQDYSVPFNLDNARQAVFAFKGDVYSGLGAEAFMNDDLDFAQEHVRILSGLYGILRPLDLIQPYRLEMGTRFGVGRSESLYEFWGARVTQIINRELLDEKQPLLVNLASDEYFKVIQPEVFNGEILKISFKENKNGIYRVIGIHAKRARGLMANYVITNRLDKRDDLLSFDREGYRFNADISSGGELVFCRG